MQKPEILKTKPHFQILDGLRGAAALAIVIFHFMEWIFPDASENFIGHGFLAVDFFFCLSGFVIAYAYDNRIEQMGILDFFKRRLIRLHPLVILGAVLGLLAFLFDPFSANSVVYDTGKLILLFVCSLFLFPLPAMEDRFFNLFGLNAPAWSLFWEYIANIFYAIILFGISRQYILILTLLAAACLGYVGYTAGNPLGGWNGETFWHGGARIFYSFLAGMLIHRYNWIIQNKIGFAGLVALLFLAFIMPHSSWNWLTESFIVIIYFPLLVSLGAGAMLSPGLKKICVFSGNISYPLYMTHYAAIWMFGNYYTNNNPGTLELSLIVIIGTILLVGFAYLVMKFYDIPLRRYLSRRKP